jgi:uncharacterized membrane protein
MLNKLWKWFLQGIALVAPVVLTIALLVWLGAWSERTVGQLIKAIIPAGWYFEGLGLLAGIGATLAIGIGANFFLVRWIVQLFEQVLDRIPLVKSLFQAFKDIARLLSSNAEDHLGQVVAVDFDGTRLVGFVMQQDARLPGEFMDEQERVAVYLPMSYQLGGYTVHVKRERITPLDVSTDQAMRAVLTGGSLQARG